MLMFHQFLLVFVLFVSSIATLLVFYILGKCVANIQSVKQQSNIASLAAIHALIESEGLRKSTIIQRIVEKYHVVPEKGDASEEIKKLEQEFEAIISPIRVKEQQERAKQMRAAEAFFEAKDLV